LYSDPCVPSTSAQFLDLCLALEHGSRKHGAAGAS